MDDMPDRGPGDVLRGRYRLVEPLGEGGMAVVWRGFDQVLGRQVALKLLKAELAGDARAVQRMRREAQVAGLLAHPHIAAVHDYGESVRPPGTAQPFVVMPVLDGRVLQAVLAEEQLEWQPVVTMAAQIASALAAAHARGIVHRDVTAYNIMLTDTRGAQLLDFGISALIGDPEPEGGDLLGTAAYVAPERLSHADVATAIDVYAFGVVLYQALSGRMPWTARSTPDLLRAHLRLAPDPLPAIPGLPPEVATLCHQCLDKDPQQRPTSDHLAARLADLAGLPATVLAQPLSDKNSAVAGQTAFLHQDAVTAPHPVTAMLTSRRRRVALAVAAFAVPATALLATAWAGEDPAAPAPTSCKVVYQQVNSTSDQFAAEVTVNNNGRAALNGWDLRFGWPGDQNLLAAGDGSWRQNGRQVTLQPAQDRSTLNSGQSYRFAVSGRYQQINAMPAAFTVSGTPCASTVLAPTGASPSAPPTAPAQEPAKEPRKGKGKGKGNSGPG